MILHRSYLKPNKRYYLRIIINNYKNKSLNDTKRTLSVIFLKRITIILFNFLGMSRIMEHLKLSKHQTFYAVGLSYKKADAEVRGKFSLDDQAKTNVLQQAKEEGIDSIVVISTCNRTEIYGFAAHPFQLIKLLCDNSIGTVEEFQKVAYVFKSQEAINFFKISM